jgi:hypothetical protein
MPSPTTTQTLLNNIDAVRFNPSAIQRVVLNALQAALSPAPTDVVDASNPFVFLLEASSVTAAAGMIENEVLSRKQYPSLALTPEDLYLHMSDVDYIGRFAQPGLATMSLLLGKDELYAKVVVDPVNGFSKIVIPRETTFTVNGLYFTMQYPIEIRVMGHGGLQIVYDVSESSPLQTLTTNVPIWSIVELAGTPYIRIDIPVYQMQITTNYGMLNNTTGFSMTYNFPDQYYYARVYSANADGTWAEIVTTYTQQVFDPTVPTVVLTTMSGQLQVDVPLIYLSSGQLTTELRVDIYTTTGSIDLLLGNFAPDAFQVQYIDLDSYVDPTKVSPFVAPLASFTTIGLFSDSAVAGGANELSFADLRTRVMANALGENNIPITSAQLTATLSNLGYDAVLDVDNVTNRIFLATRSLPAPTDGSVSSGAGCAIITLQASMNDLVLSNTVKDNGNRITLLPSTLYSIYNGVVSVVDNQTLATLNTMSNDVLANAVNSGEYVFTPFHYVMDMNGVSFDCRSYYLDSPQVLSKSFIAENDTLGLEVATYNYQFLRTYANASTGDVDGYALIVQTQSGDTFSALQDSQIVVQLSYIPEGEIDRATLNGVLVGHVNPDGTANPTGTERLYKFFMGTNYDLDSSDNLEFSTFAMFANAPAPHFTALTTDFDLIYTVNNVTTLQQTPSSIDAEVAIPLVPAGSVGISQERFTIQLGTALTDLWKSVRTVASSQNYARYTAPVPYVYKSVVYQRDPVTGNIVITRNDDGSLTYTVLHNAGDPVLDANGHPLIQYNIGDVIVDGEGNPVVIVSRSLLRQVDIMFVDGAYYFATALPAKNYESSIPQLIVSWLDTDIASVNQKLLEQTTLYLYPKSTMGLVNVVVVAGSSVALSAQLTFTVNYYLTGTNYRNLDLRNSLTQLATTTIAAALTKSTVAINEIEATITAAAGTDVVALDVEGLGGVANYSAITALDDSIRLSIGKKIVSLADGTVGVVDAVTVNFVQHTVN